MSQKLSLLSPVGRIVRGSLYDPQTTDMDGRPLVIKSGPNVGQARVDFSFSLAIPKTPGVNHWAYEPWGAKIWEVGHAAYPAQASLPGFAWKIIDGDDTTPSMKSKPPGKCPCDNEGYKGHWVIRFSGGFAPKIYQEDGKGGWLQLVQKDQVKPGSYVEVSFTVEGNTGQSPGVYVNHSMVCFRGYGPEIQFGPNVADVGFGKAALPAGASPTPLASATPMPALPNAPGAAPAPSYAPPAAVMPNTGFINPPGAPGAVAMPPVPPVAPVAVTPVRQMTAAAQGIPYEAYLAKGWTDATLVQHGMMVA